MSYKRDVVVKIMQDWIGKKESDGSHRVIIDVYNQIKPLPRGYKVSYTDAWCATCVSAAYHKAGYDDIFPLECGCPEAIEKAKKMGIWQESDAHIPSPGDCVLYDWQDSGSGDNVGLADHIGMVESVNGNTINIIEGNYSDSVKRRAIKINGQYIRGYICPKFNESAIPSPAITSDPKRVWTYLMNKIGNPYGVAGVMGNLHAESGLIFNRLEFLCIQRIKQYEGKTYDDVSYTRDVDNGTISRPKFLNPLPSKQYGYGLCQWTSPGRKGGLYDLAKSRGVSIGDGDLQLDYLWIELSAMTSLVSILKSAKDIKTASDAFLQKFEQPGDISAAVKDQRSSYGKMYYDKFNSRVVTSIKTITATGVATKLDKNLTGSYRVTTDLYLKNDAGKNSANLVVMPKGTVFNCYGYYSDADGKKWLYAQVKLDGIMYVGFASETYVKKV